MNLRTHPNQRHGNHTWDVILHYYRCSACGYIIENRDKFETSDEGLQKEMKCPRCQHNFKLKKKKQPTFGPLLGHDPEVDE